MDILHFHCKTFIIHTNFWCSLARCCK